MMVMGGVPTGGARQFFLICPSPLHFFYYTASISKMVWFFIAAENHTRHFLSCCVNIHASYLVCFWFYMLSFLHICSTSDVWEYWTFDHHILITKISCLVYSYVHDPPPPFYMFFIFVHICISKLITKNSKLS